MVTVGPTGMSTSVATDGIVVRMGSMSRPDGTEET